MSKVNKKSSELDQNPEKLNLIFSRLSNFAGNWSDPMVFFLLFGVQGNQGTFQSFFNWSLGQASSRLWKN